MRIDDSCPYCSGHRVLAGFNDLASQHPELLAEWDWERNGDLRPDGFVSGSARGSGEDAGMDMHGRYPPTTGPAALTVVAPTAATARC